MGFKANWSEATQSNSLKPEGDYECLIAKAEERDYTNSKGEEKTCLNISLSVKSMHAALSWISKTAGQLLQVSLLD